MSKETPAKNTRLTISFPEEIYSQLEVIAKDKDVSIAWVVRDALKVYLQTSSQGKK
ncbi:ribbon-helix-helix domain-containing protein [Acinetobacter baumannii]|uniref:ribbon-helix-helix domain-containing protein n=1 Tax=Acinetobacter baumannii TaxID=470 RepID=UPI000F682691|nr:CopG family transcriptional regulator [Acinetobacter baumannii]MBU3095746.1 ribbon-helix-helix domain-containing protein [Acinetobacter baumannii]MDC5080124.1 ribbon-helix-helix domain-containing protein [Acinetobacter baumannii]MDC5165940.1 ribbon-helix-helix domain-containing protein [Acinetobacter baumannii]RSF40777.1 CopG family transcriptional regulator [Acinetobacter baumannii]HAV5945237.1 ribbon-helix-helix protein, CopG family [Acinetobacter baumannii]